MLISWKVFIKQKVVIKVFSVFLRNEAGGGGGGGVLCLSRPSRKINLAPAPCFDA